MKKDEYIASAVSKISNRKAKRETERELGEHIDELIDFYLDRNMTAEEAEERAVSDMGGPELIADKMNKLHPSADKGVLLGIVASILATRFVLELFPGIVHLTYFSFVDMFGISEWYTLLTRDYIILIVLSALTFACYQLRGRLLGLLLSVESILILLNITNIVLIVLDSVLEGDFSGIFIGYGYDVIINLYVSVIIGILAVCTYLALRDEDKEKVLLNNKVKSALAIVLSSVFIFACAFYTFWLPKVELKQYEKHMPKEIASDSLIKKNDFPETIYSPYDIDYYQLDYGDDYYNGTQSWHSVPEQFRPTKKMPESFCDYADVWILNDNPDYLLCVEGGRFGGVSASIHISNEVLRQYDFLTAELSSVEVGDAEILSELTEDELYFLRNAVDGSDYPDMDSILSYVFEALGEPDDVETDDNGVAVSDKMTDIIDELNEREAEKRMDYDKIPHEDFKASYEVYWHFKGLDCAYRVQGLIVETVDGKLYATHHISEGYQCYESEKLYELDGEIKDKIQKAVSASAIQKKVFSEHELARQMKDSAETAS